jgi:Ni/Fe-hydrogenase subunit HybB-like protein
MTVRSIAIEARPRTWGRALTLGDAVIGFLAFLTLMGVVAGVGRLYMGMGATTGLTDRVPWGIWIGFDFLLIAFSGAGFTMAALVHVFHLERFKDAVKPAVLAGFLGYVAVLLLLVLDLGRPDRFYSFIVSWNWHSPLFEVSWCVLLYTTVLVIENSPLLLERLNWQRPLRLAFKVMPAVAIIGVTLSSLHQSTLGTLYLDMPYRLNALWYTPLLPVDFFVSSIMAGLSVAVIVYMVSARISGKEIKRDLVDGLGKGVAWVAAGYVALKLAEVVISGETAQLMSLNSMSRLYWFELGVGAILPAVLLLAPRFRAHPVGPWIGPGLVLLGVAANRFDATLFAQISPAGALYVPSILEWLSTIGVLAGVSLVWYLGVRLLSLFDSKAEREMGAHH